ncbi:MAG: hypothetical protein F6J90_27125 [Moorea sp. SIOASIH]|nr:hypothetical protein [Moorena sp. SIOASIH]NEO39805.1 hypothetical protein [Moorena sp. SIOASIH]
MFRCGGASRIVNKACRVSVPDRWSWQEAHTEPIDQCGSMSQQTYS